MIASIIVVAHNHLHDLTIPCLDHITSYTFYPYELLLIDDGSTDGTIQYFQTIASKSFRLSKRSGPAVARNIGILNSIGDPVIFLDNDIFVTPGWLVIMVEECKKERIGILAAIPSTELDRLKKPPAPDLLLDFPAVGGGSTAITRQCLSKVGYFDESLHSSEDTDFCYRALERGFRVASTPRLVFQHTGGGTRRYVPKKEIIRSAQRFRAKWIKYQGKLPMPLLYPFE